MTKRSRENFENENDVFESETLDETYSRFERYNLRSKRRKLDTNKGLDTDKEIGRAHV